jgi:hypothetical protein
MAASRTKPLIIFCVFLVALGMFLFVLYRMSLPVVSANGAPQAGTPIPLTPKPMYKVPGWEQIVVGSTKWSNIQSALVGQGYTIAPIFSGKSGAQQYEVMINTTSQPKNFDPNRAMINGTVSVVNDQLEYSVLSVSRSGTGKNIAGNDWQLVDPTVLLSNYGVPDDFLMTLTMTGQGLAADIFAVWKQVVIAVSYGIRSRPQDNQGKSLQLCFFPDRVSQVLILTTPPGKDALQIMTGDLHVSFSRRLTQGMFTGINDLNALTQVLVSGKCLETPLSFWE